MFTLNIKYVICFNRKLPYGKLLLQNVSLCVHGMIYMSYHNILLITCV